MKSEEEDEDKGRARRDHGEDALPIHAPAASRCGRSGARTRTGVMWRWGELAYADVCELSEEGESQLSLACSSSYLPPSLPRRCTPAPPSLLREGRGSGTPRSGRALRRMGMGPRRRAIGPRHLRHLPLPLPLLLPYALHASIAGATRTPPRARPRVNREVPPVSMRTSGGQDEVGGCPLLAHLCVLQRRFRLLLPLPRVRPGCGRRYPQAYSTVSAARGPFSLLLAVGTPADRRAAETAKARSRIATPSSGPDSAVQRISDAVVAPRPPIFVLFPFPSSLHLCSIPSAAVPITIPHPRGQTTRAGGSPHGSARTSTVQRRGG
jgi:hypothetical protein